MFTSTFAIPGNHKQYSADSSNAGFSIGDYNASLEKSLESIAFSLSYRGDLFACSGIYESVFHCVSLIAAYQSCSDFTGLGNRLSIYQVLLQAGNKRK
jgi:hypothetical protein